MFFFSYEVLSYEDTDNDDDKGITIPKKNRQAKNVQNLNKQK